MCNICPQNFSEFYYMNARQTRIQFTCHHVAMKLTISAKFSAFTFNLQRTMRMLQFHFDGTIVCAAISPAPVCCHLINLHKVIYNFDGEILASERGNPR